MAFDGVQIATERHSSAKFWTTSPAGRLWPWFSMWLSVMFRAYAEGTAFTSWEQAGPKVVQSYKAEKLSSACRLLVAVTRNVYDHGLDGVR